MATPPLGETFGFPPSKRLDMFEVTGSYKALDHLRDPAGDYTLLGGPKPVAKPAMAVPEKIPAQFHPIDVDPDAIPANCILFDVDTDVFFSDD